MPDRDFDVSVFDEIREIDIFFRPIPVYLLRIGERLDGFGGRSGEFVEKMPGWKIVSVIIENDIKGWPWVVNGKFSRVKCLRRRNLYISFCVSCFDYCA